MIEDFVLGTLLAVMTLFLTLCALAITPLLWVPVICLVWANLIFWGWV